MATTNACGNGLSGTTGTGNYVGASSPTIVTPVIAQINDASGNAVITNASAASAVNNVRITNSSTGTAPIINSIGTDTNIGLTIGSKGDAGIGLVTAAVTSAPIIIYSGTSSGGVGQHQTNFVFVNSAAAQTVAFPDATGTVTLLGNSSTGSGNVVLATSPSLTTPNIGAASATSINFGGSTLSNYISEGSFTPAMTFATPGNLSVSYATQTGEYTRIGSIVYYTLILTCTPTFTTSSGIFQITGLPITVAGSAVGSMYNLSGITFPAGTTYLQSVASSSVNAITIYGSGTVTTGSFLTTSNFTTATVFGVVVSGFYFV